MQKSLQNIKNQLFNFFIPKICAGCGKVIESPDLFICEDCLKNILPACKSKLDYEYNKNFSREKIISGFESLFVFQKDRPVQNIIHSFKYNSKFYTAQYMGDLLGKANSDIISSWEIDLIIPIPLHRIKEAARSYNQSFYIAKGLAKTANLKVDTKAVKRIKNTPTQTGLNIEERKLNMENAFVVKNEKRIKNKNILLIDDLMTTGATTQECGRVLINKGAAKIYAMSVAVAE